MATVTIAGTTKLYTRQKLTDNWTEQTNWMFGSTVQRSCGAVSALMFTRSYAQGFPAGDLDNLSKHWMKVTYTPNGGSETLIWYGNIEDCVINEQGLYVEWYANSLEAQLRHIRLSEAWAKNLDDAGQCFQIGLREFNELTSTAPGIIGLRSDTQYHCRRDDLWRTKYDAPERQTDLAYVFGTDSPWRNYDIIEALLSWYTGGDQGGQTDSPLTFKLKCSGEATTRLQGMVENWDFLGKELLDCCDDLVTHSGPLLWYVDATDYDAGTNAYVDFVVACRQYADKTTEQNEHSIAKSDCLAAEVRCRVKDRVTTVIARGARRKVMFSVKHVDDDMIMKVTGPTYDKLWTSTQQTAYLAAAQGPGQTLSSYFDTVFLGFYIPYNQVDGDGASTWQRLFCRDDGANYWNEYGDVIAEDTSYVPTVDAMYFYPRRLLAYNLAYQGYNYHVGNIGTLPTAPAGYASRPEHEPILCWFIPPFIDDANKCSRIPQVTRIDDAAGFRITERNRREEKEPSMSGPAGTRDNWKHLLWTVSMELDTYAQYIVKTTEYEDDQGRCEIIEMPECEWWAAVGAALDVTEDRIITWAYGVIRNDIPKLKQAAEKRMVILNQTVISSGLTRPHYHCTIPFKVVRVTYADTALKLGDFVKVYGGHPVESPIMTITHELMDPDSWGTTLTTYRPLSQRSTP